MENSTIFFLNPSLSHQIKKSDKNVAKVKEVELWIIITSPKFTEDALRTLIPAEKYEVKLVKIKNRVLVTVKTKYSKMDPVDVTIFPYLTLFNSAFEKGRKVRKSLKELTKTPCCYLEFGPI